MLETSARLLCGFIQNNMVVYLLRECFEVYYRHGEIAVELKVIANCNTQTRLKQMLLLVCLLLLNLQRLSCESN